MDGATYGDKGAGMSVVIRDHNGLPIRFACQQVQLTGDAILAEAKAIVLGLKMKA